MAAIPRFRLSGFYFFYFAVLGVLIPYWPLYLENAGYDPERIGWLMAILPAARIVSPGIWGWLSDRTHRTLGLVRWGGFLAAVCLAWVFPPMVGPGQLAFALLAFSFCWNGTLPLFETLTLAHLGGNTIRYGRIRLWGSVGFIVSVWGTGEVLGIDLPLQFLPWLMVLLLAGQWLTSLAVPHVRIDDATHESQNLLLGSILRRGGVLRFLLAALLLQAAHGPYYAFYSIYLDDHGFPDGLIGSLWALGVVSEILLFLHLHRLLRMVSLRKLWLASLAMSVLRWLMIAWGAGSPACLVAAQVLHAATFGTAHVAAIHYIHQNFSGPHHGKGQALYSAVSYGAGGAIGSLASGWAWQSWGGQWVFTASAGVSLLALLVALPDGSGKPRRLQHAQL